MRAYLCLLLLLLLGSCVGPDYERPPVRVPPAWKNQPVLTEKDQRGIDINWWHNFHDPQLDTLIKEASKSNLDYLTAVARIREARANFAGVRANLYPTISASGSASREFSGARVPSLFNASGHPKSAKIDLYAAGFDANWEIDIFGAVRRGEETALAILESVEDNARITLVSLMAEIAQNYINLRSYQRQLGATREIAALWRDNLNLQTGLEKSGLTNQVTTETAQSSRDQALAAIPPLEAAIKVTAHHLGILLGKDPAAFYDQLLLSQGEIPHTSEAVIAGLPAELICRRPDIRMNERLLASATAQIGIATAALFPQFQLTGSLNYEGTRLPALVRPGSQYWQYGLNFSVPIFDFGKIRAQIDAKYAQKDEALLTYQKSILTALEEVENGLVTYANESNRHHQLQSRVAAQERAYNLIASRHKAGLSSYLDVLQAKIALLNGEIIATQSQATVALNLVALYKALGGGWEAFAPEKDVD